MIRELEPIDLELVSGQSLVPQIDAMQQFKGARRKCGNENLPGRFQDWSDGTDNIDRNRLYHFPKANDVQLFCEWYDWLKIKMGERSSVGEKKSTCGWVASHIVRPR